MPDYAKHHQSQLLEKGQESFLLAQISHQRKMKKMKNEKNEKTKTGMLLPSPRMLLPNNEISISPQPQLVSYSYSLRISPTPTLIIQLGGS
jgi:hypothetical protein